MSCTNNTSINLIKHTTHNTRSSDTENKDIDNINDA